MKSSCRRKIARWCDRHVIILHVNRKLYSVICILKLNYESFIAQRVHKSCNGHVNYLKGGLKNKVCI